MFTINSYKRVKGTLDNVWSTLTDVESFANAAPNIIRGEQIAMGTEGPIWQLYHKNGLSWEEECRKMDKNAVFIMEIKTPSQYTLPITLLRRSTTVTQRKYDILIQIDYEYTPRYGALGYFLEKYQIRPILNIFAEQLLQNFARQINEASADKGITAETIIKNKTRKALTISPTTLIAEVAKILSEQRIGCLIVLDDQQKIAGILSERDIVHGLAGEDAAILTQKASQWMSTGVITCHPEDNLATLMETMNEKRIRHLPIVDHQKGLLGVVSIGDVVNSRIQELELQSVAMSQYIESRKWRELAIHLGRSAASDNKLL